MICHSLDLWRNIKNVDNYRRWYYRAWSLDGLNAMLVTSLSYLRTVSGFLNLQSASPYPGLDYSPLPECPSFPRLKLLSE